MNGAYTDWEAVADAIVTLLASIVSTALVTRHFQDLKHHGDRQQRDGVYTVLLGPLTGYGYEYRPGDLSRRTVWIYAEKLLPGEDPGPAIDAAEAEMIADIERLAREAPEDEQLIDLFLQSITNSAQTTPPFASVLGQFVYGVDPR